MPASDDFFALGNQLEAGFWILIGLIFAATSVWKSGPIRLRCLEAAIALVLFGCSDLVEAHTGAWWRPWWLLVWKAACVLVLAGLTIDYWRRRRL